MIEEEKEVKNKIFENSKKVMEIITKYNDKEENKDEEEKEER